MYYAQCITNSAVRFVLIINLRSPTPKSDTPSITSILMNPFHFYFQPQEKWQRGISDYQQPGADTPVSGIYVQKNYTV